MEKLLKLCPLSFSVPFAVLHILVMVKESILIIFYYY